MARNAPGAYFPHESPQSKGWGDYACGSIRRPGVFHLATACAPGTGIEVTTPETTLELTTPGPNPQLGEPDAAGRVAGIAQGLWHGLIAPVAAVGSFFNPAMQMYEVHNNGREYNLGFLIGVTLVFLLLGVMGGRRG